MLERNFLLTLTATFLLFLAVTAFVLMPRQLWEFGAPDSEIGWVMGVSQLVTALTMPVVGLLLHRVSPKTFMIGGGLLFSVSCAVIAPLTEVGWLLYAMRALQGLAFASFFVSAGTLVVTVVPEAKRAQGISLWGAGVLITQALAPIGGEWLIARGSFADLYLAAAVACAAAAVVSVALPRHRPSADNPTPLGRLVRKPAVAVGLFALLTSSLGFGSIYAFLSAFSEQEQLGPVAPFFVAYTVGSLAIRVVASKLADRYERRLVIIPALLVCALAIAALAVVRAPWHLTVVGAAYGIGSGVSYPALMAYVVDQADEADRARAVALDNWAFTLGMLFSAAGFGVAADEMGMRFAFASVAFIGIVASILMIFGRSVSRRSKAS